MRRRMVGVGELFCVVLIEFCAVDVIGDSGVRDVTMMLRIMYGARGGALPRLRTAGAAAGGGGHHKRVLAAAPPPPTPSRENDVRAV